MQKIRFLINSLSSGGAEKVLSVLVTELIKQKHEVEVIFLEKNEFYELPKEVKKTYLSDFIGKESGLKKLLYLPIFAWKLKKYVKENNINLIQSHIYRANYVNILAKIFGSKHQVQIVNVGVITYYLEEGLLGKINIDLVKFLYPKADLIIWKSEGMLTDAKRIFISRTKEIVINNPYDIKYIQRLSSEKIDFKFDTKKKYLVSVGSLIPLKRNTDLIHALAQLSQDVEVLFLGDGEEKSNLFQLVKELNLEKRVHFLGNVSNPYKYLSNCNIFVHTSKTEGFPNVLVEAMICGLPVISSDCISGPREILSPSSDINKQLVSGEALEIGEFGVLYPVGDVDNLIKSINFLVDNSKTSKEYVNKGLHRVENFSAEKIARIYKKELEI